ARRHANHAAALNQGAEQIAGDAGSAAIGHCHRAAEAAGEDELPTPAADSRRDGVAEGGDDLVARSAQARADRPTDVAAAAAPGPPEPAPAPPPTHPPAAAARDRKPAYPAAGEDARAAADARGVLCRSTRRHAEHAAAAHDRGARMAAAVDALRT